MARHDRAYGDSGPLRYGADCFDLFDQFTDHGGSAAVSRYPQRQPDMPAVATFLGRES